MRATISVRVWTKCRRLLFLKVECCMFFRSDLVNTFPAKADENWTIPPLYDDHHMLSLITSEYESWNPLQSNTRLSSLSSVDLTSANWLFGLHLDSS